MLEVKILTDTGLYRQNTVFLIPVPVPECTKVIPAYHKLCLPPSFRVCLHRQWLGEDELGGTRGRGPPQGDHHDPYPTACTRPYGPGGGARDHRPVLQEDLPHRPQVSHVRITTTHNPSSVVCAGPEGGGRDSCQGDSGGEANLSSQKWTFNTNKGRGNIPSTWS